MSGETRLRSAAAVLVLCGACSGSIMRVGSQYAASAQIGPNGGTLTVTAAEDPVIAGTSITIPAGALTSMQTIQIGDTNQSVAPSGATAYSKAIDFEPSGLIFLKPASISLELNSSATGVSASQIAVMAVETSGSSAGSSQKIAPVTVANGLATFQANGFTLFGAFDDGADGGSEDDGGCTPSCAGDATCGSSDGCGGSCNANCGSDGGCTPNCAGDATCGSSDGCGGTCDANCTDGGCTPNCTDSSACGSSDGCGGTCNGACDAGCQPETDTFVVGPPKADVLIILDVDDDQAEQALLISGIGDFITAGASIDYRIAVTTDNDWPSSTDAEFGNLLPCPTCSLPGATPTIVSPSSVPAGGVAPDPTTVLSDLIGLVPNSAYPTGAPTDEHFFLALYNALQIGPQPGVDFFRPGVFFAALTMNGDNESDASVLGKGNHYPAWYAAWFETYFQNPYLFTWNYLNPTETASGTGFSDLLQEPPAIQTMVTDTNGFAVNSNDPAWTTAIGSIWTSAITASTYYRLLGVPSEGSTGIVVTINGVTVPEFAGPGDPNWTYQATLDAIIFNPNTDPPKTGDSISVTYPIVCGGGPGGCEVCDGGSCTSSCLQGNDPWCCGTTCADEDNDSNNCGACGNVCSSPATVCLGGVCSCPDSEFLCNDADGGVYCSATLCQVDPPLDGGVDGG